MKLCMKRHMKQPIKLSFCLHSLIFLSLFSHAADEHVHGEAELFIAIDDNKVLLTLESPADNILGFEYEPSTPTEEKRLEDSLKTLANYTSLVVFAEGGCQQLSTDLKSPFEEREHEEDHGKYEDDHHDHDQHSEDHSEDKHSTFHINYTLNCKDTASIKGANISAFTSFEGFKNIQVNWVTSNKQGSQKASAKNTYISYN